MRRLWYNSKFGAQGSCARRQTKKIGICQPFSNPFYIPLRHLILWQFNCGTIILFAKGHLRFALRPLCGSRTHHFTICNVFVLPWNLQGISLLHYYNTTFCVMCQHFFEKCLGFLVPKHLSLTLRTQRVTHFVRRSSHFPLAIIIIPQSLCEVNSNCTKKYTNLGKKICANFLNFSLDKMRGLVV